MTKKDTLRHEMVIQKMNDLMIEMTSLLNSERGPISFIDDSLNHLMAAKIDFMHHMDVNQ